MTVSDLIALLMDYLSSKVVNYCILYAQSTFTLLICLMPGAVVHRRNLISASSFFSVSSVTVNPVWYVYQLPWSLHSCVIFRVFPVLFLFSSSFLADQVSSLLSRFTIDKRSASMSIWRNPSYQTCTPISIQAYGLFDQPLEELINKKSIHGYDVLLPVAFKEHRPSTNRNSVVQLCKFAFRVYICYRSRRHFTRRARQSSLSSCSRVHPLPSHLPNSEWQWSSVPVVLLHMSRWCATSKETDLIIHIRPSSILQPHYCRQACLSSLHCQSLEQSPMPAHLTSASSLTVFRQRLKTFLFQRSHPNLIT